MTSRVQAAFNAWMRGHGCREEEAYAAGRLAGFEEGLAANETARCDYGCDVCRDQEALWDAEDDAEDERRRAEGRFG